VRQGKGRVAEPAAAGEAADKQMAGGLAPAMMLPRLPQPAGVTALGVRPPAHLPPADEDDDDDVMSDDEGDGGGRRKGGSGGKGGGKPRRKGTGNPGGQPLPFVCLQAMPGAQVLPPVAARSAVQPPPPSCDPHALQASLGCG
jgi:hypothetical protein